MGHKATTSTERYRVSVYGRLTQTADLGSVDVEHGFSNRSAAERFAEAISHRIPAGSGPYGVLAWVLVSALPDPAQHCYPGDRRQHCYFAYDHGGIVVKRHPILRGFYGYRAPRLTERAA